MERLHRGFGCAQQDAEGDGGVHEGSWGAQRGMEKGFGSAKKVAEGDVGCTKGLGECTKGMQKGFRDTRGYRRSVRAKGVTKRAYGVHKGLK